MISFKEYILLEDRVNWNEYGSWINSKTREVLEVELEQHENDMDEYIKKNHPKIINHPAEYGKHDLATDWAIDNDWVRLVHKDYGDAMNIQGSIKNIKKINQGQMPFMEKGCATLLKKMIYKKKIFVSFNIFQNIINHFLLRN